MLIEPADIQKITSIFMPHAYQKTNELHAGGRLVHYTTAENALNIIKTKTIWLRDARNMHDFSELQHGLEELRGCLHADERTKMNRLIAAIDHCAHGAGKEAVDLFDSWWANIRNSTYISCFSQHNEAEDWNGRLSMWRAFGQSSIGVALVLRPPPPHSADPIKAILSPVGYFTQDELSKEIDAVIENVEKNHDFLSTLDKNMIVGFTFTMLLMAVTSMKHKSFIEEQEWRLVYIPPLHQSEHIHPDTAVIAGIPQVIQKLPLVNNPEAEINNISIPDLFERIIIGPSDYANAIRDAFVYELSKIGVQDAAQKVFISGIPLR